MATPAKTAASKTGYDAADAAKVIKLGVNIAERVMQAVTLLAQMAVPPKGKANNLNDLIDLLVVARKFEEMIDDARKEITKQVLNLLEQNVIPAKFEDEGITTMTTDTGFRVTVGERLSVSIIPEKKLAAFEWLRKNELGELITETVNAQTLSAQARQLLEEKNIGMPGDYFKTSTVSTISLTDTKKNKR